MTDQPSGSPQLLRKAGEMERKHSSSSLISLSTELPMLTPEQEEEEKIYLQKIITALRYYRLHVPFFLQVRLTRFYFVESIR